MRNRALAALFSVATVAAVAACAGASEETLSSEAHLQTETFDKNDVVDDAWFTDAAALDRAKVQAFLESTPFTSFFFFHTTSPLATFRDEGKLASEILVRAAQKHRISPLELLVALEAEQSLVSATSLNEDKMKLALRCGCPDGDECRTNPAAFIGFTKQVECYAGSMRAALDAQREGEATKAGWKRGQPSVTRDEIVVVPANAATAALYSYTPAVGSGGGGDPKLGGTSKHWELLVEFAKHAEYTGPARVASADAGADAARPDAAAPAMEEEEEAPPDEPATPPPAEEEPVTPPPVEEDPAPTPTADPKPPAKDAGAADASVPAVPKVATDAEETAQPPSGHGDDDDDDDAPAKPAPEFARRASRKSSGGCSAAPGTSSLGSLAGLGLVLTALARRRRANS